MFLYILTLLDSMHNLEKKWLKEQSIEKLIEYIKAYAEGYKTNKNGFCTINLDKRWCTEVTKIIPIKIKEIIQIIEKKIE